MPLSLVPRSAPAKLAASAAGLLAVLACGEAALRASGFTRPRAEDRQLVWSAERDAELVRGDGLYRFDPDCLWSPRPGALIPWTDGARVNPDGFRGPQLELARRPGVLRVATLGGATTFGVGVRWEDTYSAMLGHLLTEQGVATEVLCAGAEDYTIVQGLARWRSQVRAWQPHVLVCAFTGNMESRQTVQGRRDSVRIGDMQAHPRIERASDLRDTLRLLHLAAWLGDAASGSYWEERDFAFGALRRAPTFGDLDWPGERRVPYDEFVEALADLARECREERIVLILLSIPRAPGLASLPVLDVYERGAAEVARREGAIVVDGGDVLLRTVLEESSPPQDLFLGEFTLSECGQLAVAQALADEILARRERRR